MLERQLRVFLFPAGRTPKEFLLQERGFSFIWLGHKMHKGEHLECCRASFYPVQGRESRLSAFCQPFSAPSLQTVPSSTALVLLALHTQGCCSLGILSWLLELCLECFLCQVSKSVFNLPVARFIQQDTHLCHGQSTLIIFWRYWSVEKRKYSAIKILEV